jgi:hypothetical protein
MGNNIAGVKTQMEILTILAVEREFPQIGLKTVLEKDYATVVRNVSSLEKKHIIQLVRVEKTRKGGKAKKIYTLTISGLFESLKIPAIYDYIDEVAANYSNYVPLIFGKWLFFKEKGCISLIIKRLRWMGYRSISQLGNMSENDLKEIFSLRYDKATKKIKYEAGYGSVQKNFFDQWQETVTIPESALANQITEFVFNGFPPEPVDSLILTSNARKDPELDDFINEKNWQMVERITGKKRPSI